MERSLLLVIDLQNEFINSHTKPLVGKIKKLLQRNNFDFVASTRFINSANNPTFTRLGWKGCMDEESRKICVDTTDYPVFEKTTYSAYNSELASFLKQNNIGKIYLCGVDADCCVLVTAMNLFENGYDIYVLEEYTYSTQGEVAKNHAFDILKRNIGAERLIGKRPEVSNSPA